jgi:hypothetical protein
MGRSCAPARSNLDSPSKGLILATRWPPFRCADWPPFECSSPFLPMLI